MRVFTFGEAKANPDSGHRCGPDAHPANANVRDEGPVLKVGRKFLDKAGT